MDSRKKQSENFDIRYTNSADEPYLNKWLEDERCSYWFPMQSKEEKKLAVRNWLSFARYRCSLTAILNDKPVAMGILFLSPYRKLLHHAMFYMIVDPHHLREGIGRSMLKNLLHLGKSYFRLERLNVEVFEGSPLISLLKEFSFRCYAHHPKYVKLGKNRYLDRFLYDCFLQDREDV